MSLPIFQTNDKNFQLLQTGWGTQLNPLLANPLTNGIFLPSIPLTAGTNTINHLLARMQQGYIITDITGPSTIYRAAPLNSKTLTLISSGNCTVNLYVF